MEYINMILNETQSMENNIIELIQGTDDLLSLAGILEHRLSIQATLSSGDWILSIGQWDKPSLVVYECNNNPFFEDIKSYTKDEKEGLIRLKNEARVEGDSFAQALQNAIIEDIETETFYSAIIVEKAQTRSVIEGYYDKASMGQAVINTAHNKDYQGFEFDEYESKDAAIAEQESSRGAYDNDEDRQYYTDVIKKIETLECEGKVVVYTVHCNVSVEAWREESEFEWAWEAVTHDLQDCGYITLAEGAKT